MSKETLQQEFNFWKQKNKLFGRQAFLRFMILKFLEALQGVAADEFIFKGGNLLWHYIKTPRATVDLDLVTQTINSHEKIKEHLKACSNYFDTVTFHLDSFKELQKDDSHGAEVVISFKTDSGQINKIHIDIVYEVPTDLNKVSSTFSDMDYIAASIENIIYDPDQNLKIRQFQPQAMYLKGYLNNL